MSSTLIDPSELATHLGDPSWVVVDCRFDLTDPARGERDYLAGHIPGARYADLDRDLSGDRTGVNGRHPLPSPADMCARFGALGIGPKSRVVACDADSGMYAARLWWMLRYMGHDSVAVLDGGLSRWTAEGHVTESGRSNAPPVTFHGQPRTDWLLTVHDVVNFVRQPLASAAPVAPATVLLIDARSPDRFRGIGETLDKTGGHIPGAANYFFQRNVSPEKVFKRPSELRAQWDEVLKGRDPRSVVMYCGSGVTACHNLLSMEVAGLTGARIFPGSWSEWSADPSRPVSTDEPA